MAFKEIILILAVLTLTTASIPSYIKVCKANDPDISNCIKSSIESLRDILRVGIDELTVPALEPLRIATLTFKNNPKSNLTDLVVNGLSGYIINEFKAEIAKNRFASVVTLPKVTLNSKYNVDLKILVAQIKGAGNLHADFENMQGTILLKGKKISEGGKTFLKFEPIKVTVHWGKPTLKLDNLFQGQRALGDATNDVINDNPEVFLGEIQDSLELSLSHYFTEVANKITTRFTYDELFPSQ